MSFFKALNIVKTYANHKALDDVSINIPEGAIYGLLGPNGAGKTSLIRIINQITAPDSGEIFFRNEHLQPSDVNRIGYLPEERGLYKKMKVGEQAVYLARLKGISKHEAIIRLKMWFEKFEIEAWWDKKVEELSKGMAQKVQFITTVLHEPELLIFDELLYISFVNSFSNLSVRVALGIDFIIANLMIFNCSSVISPSSFKQLSTSLIFSSEYISLMLVRTGVIFSK